MQWVKQGFYQSVRVLAFKIILTLLPAAIIVDLWTSVRVIEVAIWWPTKVLLTMCVVALTPLVLLINARAK
jgi:hypothetical protein